METAVRVGVPGTASLVYRRASCEDVGDLVELRLDFMRIVKDGGIPDEPAWRAELADLFNEELCAGRLVAWLCVDSGRVVGTSGIVLPGAGAERNGRRGARTSGRSQPSEGLVLNMYTVPEYRRRGIATELLGRVLADGRAAGLARFRLQPTDCARPLYERAGFKDAGAEMVLDLVECEDGI